MKGGMWSDAAWAMVIPTPAPAMITAPATTIFHEDEDIGSPHC
jgi:hypothetical protein